MTALEARSAEEFLRPRRWTRDEYYALDAANFFGEERVELLDGEIWRLPPQTPQHYFCIQQAAELLKTAFGTGSDVRQRGPLVISEFTKPEPDVLAVVGSWRDYANNYPSSSEARLLAEVSDAGTLVKDQNKKRLIYARAGIADYWIINLVHHQLEVYHDPAPMDGDHAYKTVQTLIDGDMVAPLSAPDAAIAVADLFPPLATS